MAAPARLIREVLTSAIASLPAARQRRPIVIVLGMDGSGKDNQAEHQWKIAHHSSPLHFGES